MPRLRILNATEREAYDKPPTLNAAERRRAFDMPSSLVELVTSVQDPAQRIGFLVSAAYFTGTRRFFSPRDYHERDVAYAARRLRLPPDLFEPNRYAARTRQRHELAILEVHGMRRLDCEGEAELVIDIDAMAATHLRPKLIFWRCLDLLTQRRVQLPREHRLTALIASAMARRKQQLVERVEKALTPELRLGPGWTVRRHRWRNAGRQPRQARPPDPPEATDAVNRGEGCARPRRQPPRDQGDPR